MQYKSKNKRNKKKYNDKNDKIYLNLNLLKVN